MTKQIKVLQVFGGLGRGGAETVMMNLYRHIDREQVQFGFVKHTLETGAYEEEIRSLGGEVFALPRYTGWNHFRYVHAWRALFQAHPEYRLIHGHARGAASVYLKIARGFGLTAIAHSHNTREGLGMAALGKRVLERGIVSQADHFFACSEEAGLWLFGKDMTGSGRFHIMRNAIQPERFTYDPVARQVMRDQLGLGDRLVLGSAASFRRQKNHAFLLDAFAQVCLHRPDTALLLVGDGALRPAMQWKAGWLGLGDRVLFPGSVDDVGPYLQAMDLFVFPSRYEGFGVAALEAQAAGLPVFASTAVSPSVKATGLIRFLDLSLGPKAWAEEIMQTKIIPRADTSAQIAAAGFDAADNAQWLQDFYMGVLHR